MYKFLFFFPIMIKRRRRLSIDLNWIWQTLVIFVVGTLILRISGRRTISQMTIPETVIMIAIGTLLIQPVTGRGLWITFGVAALLVVALLVTDYIQLKSDGLETLISGKAVTIIENGTLNEKNLRKLRLPVDKLEARLRQSGIANISDVQWATLEVSGQLGYQLKTEKQPATKQDIENLARLIETRLPYSQIVAESGQVTYQENIFTEVANKGHSNPSPERLQ